MDTFNVLILSVGRRVELINCFKNAIRNLNINGIIVGSDCQETAPALYFADKTVLLPLISSPNYIDSVIDACKQYEVSLVVPTIDTDLLLLSNNKEKIESNTSAKVLVSDLNVINICRDKIKTQKFLEDNGFNVPYMYTDVELDYGQLQFPLFIKPIDGSSSINTFKVNNAAELHTYRGLIKNPMVQNCLEGEEYTVDTFLDFDSNVITIVPRLRIATRSGEISKGRIIKDREIIEDVKRLLAELKPIGHITVQCMRTKKGIEYIEINPRFGGGAPMSIASGANSCENLFKLLRGEKLNYNEDFRDKLLFLRYDSSICLNEEMESIPNSIDLGLKI